MAALPSSPSPTPSALSAAPGEDPRCCGTGMCLIDAEGRCWCGQQWNGTEMCRPPLATPAARADAEPEAGED